MLAEADGLQSPSYTGRVERVADRAIWVAIGLLLVIMAVFIGLRLVTDVPNVLSGAVVDESEFEYRYAAYPWLAYAHILPGAVYLSLAPFQLWRGFRNRNLRRHRRIGRVALVAGLISGVFGVLFGFFQSFGGTLQASATVVFGLWFLTALLVAYRAVRRRDITTHRRWMIRAFAVGLAVGTIRIWIGLFEGFERPRDPGCVRGRLLDLVPAARRRRGAVAVLASRPDGSGAARGRHGLLTLSGRGGQTMQLPRARRASCTGRRPWSVSKDGPDRRRRSAAWRRRCVDARPPRRRMGVGRALRAFAATSKTISNRARLTLMRRCSSSSWVPPAAASRAC